MAPVTKRMKPTRVEKTIPVQDYHGISTFGPHSTLPLEILRDARNYDFFPGYLKSRRGSTNLQTTGQKFASKDVINSIPWAIGSNEYEIRQVINAGATEFHWCQIRPATTAHAQILSLSGPPLTTPTTAVADMKVSGTRLYVFHTTGNFIIEWNGAAFVGRPMGLQKISLTSLAATGASSLSGRFTVGVELVYRSAGADIVAGSPNRKTSGGKRLEITVSNQNILVQLDAATFPAPGTPGDFWTDVRAWRSFSQDADYTNPLNPPDVQGLPDELYAEQLISRAALTGAGYQITLSKLDAELPADATSEYPVRTISDIELQPIPASPTGAYHRGHIWVADPSNGAIYYSNSAGDAYAEAYDPLNVLRAEKGDGQLTVALIPFEADLVILKEAKTLRVPNGDPNTGTEVLDSTIGVNHIKLATFVPKVGICAITNDQGDFRILGYDQRWTNEWANQEISRPIRTQTAAMALAPDYVSMAYVNGKLLLSDGSGLMYVFHAKEGKGWAPYAYPMNGLAQVVRTFAKGARCMVCSRSTYIVEIEIDGLDTDINTASDQAGDIACSMTYARFQSGDGRDVLELDYLSVVAQLSSNLSCTPFVNGYPWPLKTEERPTHFTPDVGAYAAGDAGLEREYRAMLEERALGQYHHFRLDTSAPATIHTTEWHGFVDTAGMGDGTFDPFSRLDDLSVTPDWLDGDILDAGGGPRDLSSMDVYDAGDGARDITTMNIIDRG